MNDDKGGMMAFYGVVNLAIHMGFKPEDCAKLFFSKPSKEYMDAFLKAGTAFVLDKLNKKN